MPINETTYGVTVAAPSRLRTELNVVAAAVAVGISLVILALNANTPATRAHRHLRPAVHTRPAVVHPLARP